MYAYCKQCFLLCTSRQGELSQSSATPQTLLQVEQALHLYQQKILCMLCCSMCNHGVLCEGSEMHPESQSKLYPFPEMCLR